MSTQIEIFVGMISSANHVRLKKSYIRVGRSGGYQKFLPPRTFSQVMCIASEKVRVSGYRVRENEHMLHQKVLLDGVVTILGQVC
jgi:hypothetical protein